MVCAVSNVLLLGFLSRLRERGSGTRLQRGRNRATGPPPVNSILPCFLVLTTASNDVYSEFCTTFLISKLNVQDIHSPLNRHISNLK